MPVAKSARSSRWNTASVVRKPAADAQQNVGEWRLVPRLQHRGKRLAQLHINPRAAILMFRASREALVVKNYAMPLLSRSSATLHRAGWHEGSACIRATADRSGQYHRFLRAILLLVRSLRALH